MLQKRGFAVLLLLCLLCVSFAAAEPKYGYPVDIATMKLLEEQSAFPVRITEKKIVLECFDHENFSDKGTDALVFTVTNGTDSVISSVKVGFIALNENGLTTDVEYKSTLSAIGLNSSSVPELKMLPRSDLSLAPGESCVLSMQVDYDYVKGVRAIVCEYGLADGSVVVNPDFELWQLYAFGLNTESGTELD